MPQPTFRLQRPVRADAIRPGAHLVVDDEIVVLDEVIIGRDRITLACFPEGRTEGRRSLVHVDLAALVLEVPSTNDQIAQALDSLIGGGRPSWAGDILFCDLGIWQLRIAGAPRARDLLGAVGPVNVPVDEMLVVPLATGGIVDPAGLTLVGESA